MLTRTIAQGLRDCDVNYNRRLSPEDFARAVKLHLDVAEKAFAAWGADLTAACRVAAIRDAYAEWCRQERCFPRSAEMRPYFQAHTHPVRKRQALPGQHATPERPAGHPLWAAMFVRSRGGDNRAAAWVVRMLRSMGRPSTIPASCDAVKVVELAESSLTDDDLAGSVNPETRIGFAQAVGA